MYIIMYDISVSFCFDPIKFLLFPFFIQFSLLTKLDKTVKVIVAHPE